MGKLEGWAPPNGLLPDEAASMIRTFDSEKWLKAEERTAELIACIQPNQPSEDRRKAVADYVQRLIAKCSPCQVFTFGSVPLKTYLPDGDIDLTAFSKDHNLKDTWANQVRDTLENEEKNENAEFCVKEVQYIQAEVKIIKCLVENIVVDISFNQLGGLCTLCFLEEVDHLISQRHLFKRSIILIKAWCYYESRILGAHHGLISTYALETLVLYIFHIFNNSFTGPLEVLYRFLEFFSKFDWDNFCVSLWGPVPISSLPDMTAEPPRNDNEKLLLSKLFLDACNSVYAVFPGAQEIQGQPFVSKHFNVVDPLRINNNLGRSVSKGNFYRIRSALAFGAKKLANLLDSPKDRLYYEVNQFFMNTWDRHGNGSRPDAPRNNLSCLRPSTNPDQLQKKLEIQSSKKTVKEKNSKQGSSKPDQKANDAGKYLFARTHSSPELTDTFSNSSSSRVRRNRQISAAGLDAIRKNLGSEIFANSKNKALNNESLLVDQNPSRQNLKPDDIELKALNSCPENEEQVSVVGAQEMLQEEQDRVNMIASSMVHGLNGQVQIPMTFSSPHFPLPLPQSILASMGYAQRNMAANFYLKNHPWASNMQFLPNLVHSPMTHYIPNMEFASNPEHLIDTGIDKYGSVNLSPEDVEHDSWQGQNGENLDDRTASLRISPSVRPSSSRSKTSSENSCDGTSLYISKENWVRKAGPETMTSNSVYWKGKTVSESLSNQGDEYVGDRNSLSAQTSGSDSIITASSMYGGPGLQHRATDNPEDVPLTFYPTGPPVPFITMLPFHNYPNRTGSTESHFSEEEGVDHNSDSGQNFNSSNELLNISVPEEHDSDILNSNFINHWQNLQYGRFCQSLHFPGPMVYPPLHGAVPPMYFPWDGPGRPVSPNMNVFSTEIMGHHGPRFIPVAPHQSVSTRPSSGVYQRYVEEMPRFRGGTGTYLPNPNTSVRDRHSSLPRRSNYSYERNDNSDREGNWNTNSKTRATGRNHNRHHADRSSQRQDREGRADRPWTTYRSDSFNSNHSQNGPLRSNPNPTQTSSANVGHDMYRGVSSNGPTGMMMYSYDHKGEYGLRHEQLEFGSLGPLGFSGEVSEGERFENSTTQRSSPDQPSSPPI